MSDAVVRVRVFAVAHGQLLVGALGLARVRRRGCTAADARDTLESVEALHHQVRGGRHGERVRARRRDLLYRR